MTKKRKLTVWENPISLTTFFAADYLSLSDMVRSVPGTDEAIANWLGHKSTIDYLWLWEQLYNTAFKAAEARNILQQVEAGNGAVTPQHWVEKTAATGIVYHTGRTYAQRDVAFEFAGWLDPSFKLYLMKEYHALLAEENDKQQLEWQFRRSLAAANYRIHTSAIRAKLVDGAAPESDVYSEEAELINLALFGFTSREWKEHYPEQAAVYKTIRDLTDTHRLIVLSNLESINAVLIRQGLGRDDRFNVLRETVITQLDALQKSPAIESPGKSAVTL